MAVLQMNKRKRGRRKTTRKRRRRRNPVVSTNVRRRRRGNGGQTWNMQRIIMGAGAGVLGAVSARWFAKMILRTRDVGPMGYMANAGLSLGIALIGTQFLRGRMAKQLAALTAIGGLTATGLRFVNDQILRGQLAGPSLLGAYVPEEETPLLSQFDLEEETPAFGEYVEEDELNI